jgi:hypothetical protein
MISEWALFPLLFGAFVGGIVCSLFAGALIWIKELRDGKVKKNDVDEIEQLQSAIHDMAKNIWQGDWNRLEQETRGVVEAVMKEKGERNVL